MQSENKIDKKKLEEITGGILSNIIRVAVSSIGTMEEKGKIPEKFIDKNGIEHTIDHEKIKEVVKKYGKKHEDNSSENSKSPIDKWKHLHCKHKKPDNINYKEKTKKLKNKQHKENSHEH